jgi:hypothetical protein
MCAPLLALLLAAAPPAAAVNASDPAALAGLRAFLTTASVYAPALEPAPLGRALGSGLAVDVLDRSAWGSTGLDPAGGATAWVLDDGTTVLVLPVKDPKRLLARAHLGLESLGTVTTEHAAALTTLTARSNGAAQGQVVVGKGKVALWLGGGHAARTVEALSAKQPAPELARGLTGPLTVLADAGLRAGLGAGLSPKASELGMDVRFAGGGPLLAHGVESALGKLVVPGALFVRADLSPLALREVRGNLLPLLQSVLPESARPGATPLLESLSGPVALVVTGLDPDAGKGHSEADNSFLLRQALAAEVKDPAHTLELFNALVTQSGGEVLPLTAPGTHARIRIGSRRELYLGLSEAILYLASDTSSREALLAGLPAAHGMAAHAGEVVLDGPRVETLLGKISILDAAKSTLLAGLFAVAVEGGPLLQALGTTTWVLEADPKGARATGTLHLAPPPH